MEAKLGRQNEISSKFAAGRAASDGRIRYDAQTRATMYRHIIGVARGPQPDLELALCLACTLGSKAPSSGSDGPSVVGIQGEDFNAQSALLRLDEALMRYPQADIFVMGEYTFTVPVPKAVQEWCRQKGRWLIAGGTDAVDGSETQFANTAFVVSPGGKVVFKQVKCVPIQFFADGVPAKSQQLWESPWGKIGICICYDLGYRRVTDRLVRLGAQGLIVPTMDKISWGYQEHQVHARVAPVRSAEYGLPIMRVCTSGISQLVLPDGTVAATAPFPGQQEYIAGRLPLVRQGTVPIDGVAAPVATAAVALFFAGYAIKASTQRLRKWRRREQAPQPTSNS